MSSLRPADARDRLAALEGKLRELEQELLTPRTGRPPAPGPPPAEPPRSHRRLGWLAAVLVLGGLGAGAAAVLALRGEDATPAPAPAPARVRVAPKPVSKLSVSLPPGTRGEAKTVFD